MRLQTIPARLPWQACMCLATLVFCLQPANAQIAKVLDDSSGRQFFINSEPAVRSKLNSSGVKPRATIYLPAESSFTGNSRPAMTVARHGPEKLVHEPAEHPHMNPTL